MYQPDRDKKAIMPPQQGFFQRYAPSSSANMAYGSTPRPGESNLGVLGRSVTGAAGMVTALPEAFATSLLQGGANSAKAWVGAIKDAYGGMTGAPVTPPAPIAQAPVPTPQAPQQIAAPAALPPVTNQRPIFSIGPKQIAAVVNALGGALTRAPSVAGAPATPVIAATGAPNAGRANAAAPGQVALSEQTQQPLPGAPKVGADGSVQYDQAWADKNKGMLTRYAGLNVVPSVVPPPGVAQGMVSGQTGGVAALTRAPRGFTLEDRARQLEGLNALGDNGRRSKSEDQLKLAGMYAIAGDYEKADSLTRLAQARVGLNSPPTLSSQAIGAQGLARQKQAADIGQQDAKLAMEQEQARVGAEQAGIETQAKQLQLQQAQQMNDLSQKMIAGDKEAAAQLAMLTKQDPGKPITFTEERPVYDSQGGVTMQKNTGYFDPSTGKVTMLGSGRPDAIPIDEAIKNLRAADTPENRAFFKDTYGQDPAQFMGR